MPLSWIVFAAIVAIGVTAFYLGKSYGLEEGYKRGFAVGHREGQKKWIEAMETRRGPDGKDELVRVVQPRVPQTVTKSEPKQTGGTWQ